MSDSDDSDIMSAWAREAAREAARAAREAREAREAARELREAAREAARELREAPRELREAWEAAPICPICRDPCVSDFIQCTRCRNRTHKACGYQWGTVQIDHGRLATCASCRTHFRCLRSNPALTDRFFIEHHQSKSYKGQNGEVRLV